MDFGKYRNKCIIFILDFNFFVFLWFSADFSTRYIEDELMGDVGKILKVGLGVIKLGILLNFMKLFFKYRASLRKYTVKSIGNGFLTWLV